MSDQAARLRTMAFSMRQQIEAEMAMSLNRTRVVAVSSGKGGVGKSTLALNMAIELANYQKKVVLMDADMGCANLDIMLGVVPRYTIQHVVEGSKGIKDILIPGPGTLQIIPGGSGINELANLNENDIRRIIIELGKLDGEYDHMIIDTGAGLSKSVINFLLAADDVIIVTTPEPTALTDAYGVIKTVIRQSPGIKINIVVNKVNNQTEGIRTAEKFKLACSRFLNAEVVHIGSICNDKSIHEGIMRQQPFISLYSSCQAARDIHDIVITLLEPGGGGEQEQQNNVGIRKFFRKITALFKEEEYK